MRKQLTLKQTQDKFIPLYISQPKPESIKIFEGCLALRFSIEVLLHPYLHHTK